MIKIEEIQELMEKATIENWRWYDDEPIDLTPDNEGYAYIPQGAHLGDSMICFGDNYEGCANDARLISALPEIAALAISLDAECRRHEWRPIKTAPKDGRHIIVADFTAGSIGFGYCGDVNDLGYREIQPWMDIAHWCEDGFYASVYGTDQEEPFQRITHWMPLPPSPASTQDDEKED